MTSANYFSNHALKLRFPWTLYHDPVVNAFRAEVARTPGLDVLNIGAGPFAELARLPRDRRRYTVCDIDARAVEAARALHGSRIVRADVTGPGAPLPYADGTFDLVASMDVIEHVVPPEPWAREALRVVKPGGRLFLTTPNYGSLSLIAIERTALEAIARAQGFTRAGIHPTPFDEASLRDLLTRIGGHDVRVRRIGLGWSLAATATKA
jgi:SAM-dependent methyltransferase